MGTKWPHRLAFHSKSSNTGSVIPYSRKGKRTRIHPITLTILLQPNSTWKNMKRQVTNFANYNLLLDHFSVAFVHISIRPNFNLLILGESKVTTLDSNDQ